MSDVRDKESNPFRSSGKGIKEKPDVGAPGFLHNEELEMPSSIFTSLRAIMPQVVVNGDINVTFNGDGWIGVVVLAIFVGIVLCGRRR